MNSTLQEVLDKTIKNIQQGKYADLLEGQDLELKKLLVSKFFYSLIEEETLNLYSNQDIALIVLLFWDETDETEQRIRVILEEPVLKNHFLHFQKQFGDAKLSHDFIIESIYIALSNNWLLTYCYEEMLSKVRSSKVDDTILSLPIKQREVAVLQKILQN